MIEGTTYRWPTPDENSYTATLKEPSLSERPPQIGAIGRPFRSLIKASGPVYPKVPPAPGNHAKVTIIDDELYVVGSDNLYPGYLSEFNYLIEGEDAVKAFIESYWEPLWKYSGTHSFNYKNTLGGPGTQLLFPLVRVNCALGVIMVIAVSCVKLLSAHNSTQHTSRKHKV